MSDQNKKALSKALDLLSKRSYSKAILEEKLRLKEFEETEIQEAIKKLELLGFVDDKRFAENLVREYSEFRRYGKQRIKLKLWEKKVPAEIIVEALEMISTEVDEENLKDLVTKNLEKSKNLPKDKRYNRTVSFLIRRGYSYEAAREAFKKYFTD